MRSVARCTILATMTRASDLGRAAAKYGRGAWRLASDNPYTAARQRLEWSRARAEAEDANDFAVILRIAERAVSGGLSAAEAARRMHDGWPRIAAASHVSAESLTTPCPPPFDLLVHGPDSDLGCCWCGLDRRLLACDCPTNCGTPEQHFAWEWSKRFGGLGYAMLALIAH